MRLDRLDAIVGLSKRRGFAFPTSEIYGGNRPGWDLGPLGVELRENVRRQWWKACVQARDDVVGLDSAVLTAPEVWQSSGHVDALVELLTECRICHRPARAAQLIAQFTEIAGHPPAGGLADLACANCGSRGSFTEPRRISGMLRTEFGVADPPEPAHFLRPEATQGVFCNVLNVMTAARRKPPFGIGQVGKAFRNEISPGPFLFRTVEFEQLDLDFFVAPGTDQAWHDYWLDQRWSWYIDLGLPAADLRRREQPAARPPHDVRPHDFVRSVDIEYRFCFAGSEWAQLEAVANRGDADLVAHTKHSTSDLAYFDQEAGERWTPYVIEPSTRLGRCMLAFLLAAHAEDSVPNARGVPSQRTVLRLDPRLAPVKAAVLPLSRNPELSPRARELAAALRRSWNVEFDDAGAIGRRYRRQDEIGTPYCVTLDFQTLTDHAVTIRERDSMRQERVSLQQVPGYLAERLVGC